VHVYIHICNIVLNITYVLIDAVGLKGDGYMTYGGRLVG
jgi:hypothetical protein